MTVAATLLAAASCSAPKAQQAAEPTPVSISITSSSPVAAGPVFGKLPPSATSNIAVPAPIRLSVPTISADLPIVAVGVDHDGQMALPEHPDLAAWYQYGPAPGTSTGAIVIAAHIDSAVYGIGPLSRLHELIPGDSIIVHTASAEFQYLVASTSQLAKNAIDMDAVFSREGPPRLHLLTCVGEFDPVTRSYDDNLWVVAEPVTQ